LPPVSYTVALDPSQSAVTVIKYIVEQVKTTSTE